MEKYCIINLKAYEEAFNTNLSLFIAQIEKCSDMAKELEVELILCVNSYDLKDAVLISKSCKIFAQHCDSFSFGSHTGSTPTPILVKLGALGTLISHSEKYLGVDEVMSDFKFANDYHLQTCVCVRDIKRMEELQDAGLKGLIALEPPELIGGDISITTANPQIIRTAKEKLSPQCQLLVGAGVKNKEDVKRALQLGAKGILVASGIVKAPNIELALRELLEGFKD